MVRLITRFRILKLLVGLLAVTQLVACVEEESSGTTVGGPPPADDPGPTQSANVSLSWVAPATRADGNPISLAEIDGYKVYYGTSTGNYTNSVDINSGSQTSVTITGLPQGTYHLAMTTYDINGLESIYSPEILKTAQ